MLSVSQQQSSGTCLKECTSSSTIENLWTASVVSFSVTIQCTCLKELASSSTTIENHSTASVVSFSATIQWNLFKGMHLLINNWESLNSKCCQFLSNYTMYLLKGTSFLVNNNWESFNSKCCQFLSNNPMEPAQWNTHHQQHLRIIQQQASIIGLSLRIHQNLLKGTAFPINNNWESLNSKCCQPLTINTVDPA